MTPLAASISDATIWSVTFDDTRSVDYDRNSFIIQATGQGQEQTLAYLAYAAVTKKKHFATLTPGIAQDRFPDCQRCRQHQDGRVPRPRQRVSCFYWAGTVVE